MHLFQDDVAIEENTEKHQVQESKAKLYANLVWKIYISNMRSEILTKVRIFEPNSLKNVITIAQRVERC
jgi:hypothetical protein